MKSRIESGWGHASISRRVAEKFSDKQWLSLINNRKLNSSEHMKKLSRKFAFSESSHMEFARLYEYVGINNPERFVSLSDRFPLDVDRHYVQAVWSIAAKTEAPKEIDDWNPASFASIMRSARFSLSHPENDEQNMSISFCRMIRERANEGWSEDIMLRVASIALEAEDFQITEDDIEDLITRSLNCVRGSAANTLSSLLWADYGRYELLKSTISCLVVDKDPAVRMAILEAVVATYNVDKEQSRNWFFQLVNSDERVARTNRSLEMLFMFWSTHKNESFEVIKKLFNSEDAKSCEMGAFITANIYIVFDEDEELLRKMIFSGDLSEDHMDGCGRVSAILMEKLEYHDRAKSIVCELIGYPEHPKGVFCSLFYRPSFILPHDIDLIKTIIAKKPNDSFLAFRHYINENDVSIAKLADIILHLCEQFLLECNIDEMRQGGYYSIFSELPSLVTKLYDQAGNDGALRSKCLNMWDALYQSDIGNARIITQKIMDY